MQTLKSMTMFKQAEKVLVGGVNSPVRAFKSVGGNPIVMDHGKAAKVFDVDGNAYTDYCLSWGALILGHNHPQVSLAVKTSIALGSSFGTTTKPEVDLAKFIVAHVPSIDLIRFVNSGTEATMSAVRLARGFTKRNKILKFDGCYHGHSDDLLATAGSGVSNLPASSSQGIPTAHLQNTLSIPYNDINALNIVLDRYGKEIACVILEPVAGNMGLIVPSLDFLRSLRALTKKHGIILIFDEVMSGFRANLGCAQTDFGIMPDLTCLGKIIGGGYPVGAYGGRKNIMCHLSPLGNVYQAGTFAGNPLVMRAGLAMLKNLTESTYKNLNAISDNFVNETNKLFKENNISAHLSNYKSMVSIRLRKEKVVNYAQAQEAAQDPVYARLFHHLLNKGIYWPPANLETFFICAKHTKKDLSYLTSQLVEFFIRFKQ